MKNSRRCSKCGGSDIVRIPDRRGRCASGNNIYTSNFENFGKIPVIRYVCCSCGYVETGWKILPPCRPSARASVDLQMENRSRRTPIEWAAGSGFVFLLWFSGGALRGPCGSIRGPARNMRPGRAFAGSACPAHIGAQEPRPGRSEPSEAPFSPLPPAPRHDIQPEPRLCPMRKAHAAGR